MLGLEVVGGTLGHKVLGQLVEEAFGLGSQVQPSQKLCQTMPAGSLRSYGFPSQKSCLELGCCQLFSNVKSSLLYALIALEGD